MRGGERKRSTRREMEAAAFRRDRLQEAVRRLGERLREVKAQEEEARCWAAYDAVCVPKTQIRRYW
jgi:hypothetical protein